MGTCEGSATQALATRSGSFGRSSLRMTNNSSVGEVLGEHAALELTADYADAYAAELGAQDVGAVARTIHQALVGDVDCRRIGQVLACDQEKDARRAHAVKRRAACRRRVREVVKL